MERTRKRAEKSQPAENGRSDEPRQRLDKWLFFARIAKTRGLAADLATAGHVRVNGDRVEQSGKKLRVGDVLTIALAREIKVLRVLACGVRRGPAQEARQLYESLNETTLLEEDRARLLA